MTKTQNSNCLIGMRCPQCRQVDRFYITGSSLFEMMDDGSVSHNDIEYGDDAYCRCPDCDWTGTVNELRKLTVEERERLVEILVHRCHNDFRYLRELVEEHVDNNFNLQEFQEFMKDFVSEHGAKETKDVKQ